MHIAYIELNNVKSYEDSGRISFAKGINAVSGKNGAGKSTILEAIGFALFDVRTHTSKSFIREGSKNGRIVVGFVIQWMRDCMRLLRNQPNSWLALHI